MKKPIKRIAVVHDLCGVGKAALSNIIPILSVMSVEPCAIPTIILSTHTGGFGKPVIKVNEDYIKRAMEHYKNIGISFDGLFVGYLGSIKNIKDMEECMKKSKYKGHTIVDPIFADNGRIYYNFDEDYVEAMKSMVGYADVITPNLTEACYLSGVPYKEELEENEIRHIAEILGNMGAKNVVITSVCNGTNIGSAIYCTRDNDFKIYYTEKEEKKYPGTGDIFASVIAGSIMNGFSLHESCRRAADFTKECINVSSQYDYDTKEGVILEKNLCMLMD
ncbi:pyridoxamine kinase [Clostridium cadaveris]|uniref:pyridoxamine kinase n=1 Tax=Clostridium cadaveris TaxID=1529 RepID=UPI000C070B3D|nr:pyridoxamine kinase [Clostridium cadaveris]